jgi:cellulase
MVYMAKADSSNGQGAVWTKIYEDGLSGGVWAVDKFRTNGGLITITLPNLEAGNYLIRPEIIALHEANNLGKAQFYNGCGQLKITGGSVALPSSGVDMTKAYSATDPGVYVNIYGGLTSYQIPGPKVWNGSGSGSGGSGTTPTTMVTTTKATTTTKAPVTTTTAAGTCATKYAQCGGSGWQGPTCCAAGSTCTASGQYYSQCL